MKTMKSVMMMLALAGVVRAGLIDGGFAAGTLGTTPVSTITDPTGANVASALYHQTGVDPVNGVSVLDQGWFSHDRKTIKSDAGDNYVEFAPNARWDSANRFWLGQLFTDTVVSGNQRVSFEIVDDAYLNINDTPRMVVEVFAMTSPGALNSRVQLADGGNTGFTQLLSEQVDISGGVGVYSTALFDMTSTATIYAIRLTSYETTGGLASGNGVLGLDNVSIIPEPSSIVLMGLGMLGALLFRFKRR